MWVAHTPLSVWLALVPVVRAPMSEWPERGVGSTHRDPCGRAVVWVAHALKSVWLGRGVGSTHRDLCGWTVVWAVRGRGSAVLLLEGDWTTQV